MRQIFVEEINIQYSIYYFMLDLGATCIQLATLLK